MIPTISLITHHLSELTGDDRMTEQTRKLRLATAWLGGCSGCHMSLLDLDERLIELAQAADLVYSPIADVKEFPEAVDVTLVEGAVANVDHLDLALKIRARSKVVVSFGDCAVTGNVTSLRNRLPVADLLTQVYHEGPGKAPKGGEADRVMPALLAKVLPLHQVIAVDAFIPGCPPDPERIWLALTALLAGKSVEFEPTMRTFG
jgi:NAD-reducing hydrogenase small subunit